MAKAQRAQGVLRGSGILVADPVAARRLHQKGLAGDVGADGALRLSVVEAAWHVAEGRLDVAQAGRPLTAADLLARGSDRAEVGFLAYAELRARGLVVRHAGDALAVWPRGVGIAGAPAFVVRPMADTDPVLPRELAAWAEHGAIVAVVDGDGAVTHYRPVAALPAGDRPLGDLPQAEGMLLADRVLVEPGPAAQELATREGLGTPTPAGLVLSFVEAEALRRRGVLSGMDGLRERARAAQPGFDGVLATYEALRGAGVVVKSGFKFGTHLRGYRGDPQEGHAEWLVQSHPADGPLAWAELSRAIRLAHGVRKRFLLAVAARDVRFVELSWFKP